MTDLNREISKLQEELKQSQNELKASNIQVSDLRRTLEEMKNQLLRKVGQYSLCLQIIMNFISRG